MAPKMHLTTAEAAKVGYYSWGPVYGQPVTLSYGFLSYPESLKFTPGQMAATEEALQLWSDVANIKFVSPVGVGDSPYVDGGIVQINFVNNFEPNRNSEAKLGGGVVGSAVQVGFNLAHTGATDLALGSYDRQALIHEIGHAIGLVHPGPYNAGDVGEPQPTYEADAYYWEDTRQYWVMSYFSEAYTGADFKGVFPSTPLLYDIVAAQHLYGANTETRKGATIYGFNSNADRSAFHIDGADDKVVFAIWDAGGNDTLDLSGYTEHQAINLAAGSFTDAGGLKGNIAIAEGVTIENAVGGSGTDYIYGNAVANHLYGGAGDDVLYGYGGIDTLEGGEGDDHLFGGSENDVLYGGAGNDLLNGEAGADTMYGGIGNDTYYVDNVGDNVVDLGGVTGFGPPTSGNDTVITTLTKYTLQDGIENLSFGGEIAFGVPIDREGTGNSADNKIYGASGRDTLFGLGGGDTLDGGAGADTMFGGAGDDLYYVDNVGDVVSERETVTVTIAGITKTYSVDAGGNDRVLTTLSSYTLAANGYVENLGYIGNGRFDGMGNGLDNMITGGGYSDTLYGLDGNDTLIGGDGIDTLVGGAGNDIYFLQGDLDIVDETQAYSYKGYTYRSDAGGIDEVRTSRSSYTLGNYVENLTYDGSESFTGTGNALNNKIVGGSEADVLSGGAGADTLEGGDGGDTLAGGADNDIIRGGSGNDVLSGGAGTDTLEGGGDTDTLEGGADADIIRGGAGNDKILMRGAVNQIGADSIDGGDDVDTLDFTDLAGKANLDLAAGNLVMTGTPGSFTVTGIHNVENATGSANADTLAGDAANNELNGLAGNDDLRGGAGDDVVDGGTGADIMAGGTGNDRYFVENAGDQVVENAGEGEDTIVTTLNQFTLGANVENLVSAGVFDPKAGDFVGIGNALANQIASGGGNDQISGGGGADEIWAGAGNDTMSGGEGADKFGFVTDWGNDTILDFEVGVDLLDMKYVEGLKSFNDLVITADDGGTRIAFGDDGVLLAGVALATVTAGDFRFAKNGFYDADGANVHVGTDEADELFGGAGVDRFQAGAGDDVLHVDNDDDVIDGGEGYDSVLADASTVASGFHFNFAGTNVEYAAGDAGSDEFDARGADTGVTVVGGDGDDTFHGGVGLDAFHGGEGIDTVVYEGSNADYLIQAYAEDGRSWMVMDLATTQVDILYDVEQVQFADTQYLL